jgi:hypothetical protein
MPYIGTSPASGLAGADLNGQSLILDADADTHITADTDDQIDISIAGADDFQFTANTFTVKDGSTVANLVVSGDTAAGDAAAIGYTASEGLILAGQGSTDDITIKNDTDQTVLNVGTGSPDVEVSAGNLLFGTAAKGVYLGVTSATAANLLDDYEEGSYTATLTCSSSGSYSFDTGYDSFGYVKVGRIVSVTGYINITGESSPSGNLRLSLPFAPVAQSEYQGTCYTRGALIASHADGTADRETVGWIDSPDGAILNFYEIDGATGAISQVQHDHVDGAFTITLNLHYYAA